MIFRRGKHVTAPDPDSGWAHCSWCGEAVPVRPDGRCGLGHRVVAPEGTGLAPEGPGPVPVAEYEAEAEGEGPVGEATAAAAGYEVEIEVEDEDPFAGLYGVLDDGDEADPADPADGVEDPSDDDGPGKRL